MVFPPATAAGQVPHTEASFGIPNFAASITGKLTYQKNYPTGCDGFKHVGGRVAILLVDRGNCTFVQKVRAAEAASVNAVIVVNNADGPAIIMVSPFLNSALKPVFINDLLHRLMMVPVDPSAFLQSSLVRRMATS
jgi:hypothetical protein